LTVLEVLITFFLPPVSVAMKQGPNSPVPDRAAAPVVRTHPPRHLRRHPGVGTRPCRPPPPRRCRRLPLLGAAIAHVTRATLLALTPPGLLVAAVSAGDAADHAGCSSRATRFFTCPGQRAYSATKATSTGIVQAEE